VLGEMVAGNKKQDEIILTQQASPVINGERGTHPRHGGGGAKSQMLLWHQYLEVLRKELGPDAAAAAAACMSTEGRRRTRKEQTSKCTIALMHVAALFFEDLGQHWHCLCSCLV
jgi:hypothetical protein